MNTTAWTPPAEGKAWTPPLKTKAWTPPTKSVTKEDYDIKRKKISRVIGMQILPEFHFDVNVTSKCNLACTYCMEGESCGLSSSFQEPTKLLPQELCEKVLELDTTKYKAVNVYFWGGEAFTNWPFCKKVMKELVDYKHINFMFYTNGVYLKKYKNQLMEIDEQLGLRPQLYNKGGREQRGLHIQVSFDGEPINTLERHTKQGPDEKMSEYVYDSYLDLKEAGFSIALKQTISARNFKYLFEVWKWHYDRGEMYGPTPDSHGADPNRPDGGAWEVAAFEENLKQLRLNMIKISKYCIDRNIDPDKTFRWYGKSRADCGSGMNYLSVDLDGKLYPCHGCMYRQRDDHLVGTTKENLQDIASTTTEKYMDYLYEFKTDQTLDCNNCTVDFCMKCPAGSFDQSMATKEDNDYGKTWQDHPSNYQMCKVWKTISPIVKATRESIKERFPKRAERKLPNMNMPLCKPELASVYDAA